MEGKLPKFEQRRKANGEERREAVRDYSLKL
jgi:hypothetical protein